MNDFDFTGQVAIVTGAGLGLGRCHALELAGRGARVVVNDLADRDGNTPTADAVVEEIRAAGGEAIAHGADAAQVQDMVQQAMDQWGRVDILINNAVTRIYETAGLWLPESEQTPEGIAANWERIADISEQRELGGAFDQSLKFVKKCADALGIELDV